MKTRLLTAFYATPWAIVPAMMPVIRDVLHRWASGTKLSSEEIAAAVGDAPEAAAHRREQSSPRGIGIISILGIVAQRTASDVSTAGTSTESVRRQFRAMMNDDRIDAIILDIDSPGGSVFGVQELADDIYAARGSKKVVAVANSLAASAAYWIGSAADEFVVTKGGEVGAIGVIAAHEDHSKELEAKGIDVTVIRAGKFKGEGNPFGPLDEEAVTAIQGLVNDYYDSFVNAVAMHRGVTGKDVRSGFGEGRSVVANNAVAMNMVDRIETLDETIERLITKPRALAPKRRVGDAKRILKSTESKGSAAQTGKTGVVKDHEPTKCSKT